MTRRVAGQRRPTRGPEPDREPDLVVVGRIGRPQGVKGEVTVEVRTDDPDDRFADGAALTTETGTLTVESSRYQGKYLVVAFEGIADRNQAEVLRDTLLHVDRSELPPLEDEDDFYDTDLVGLRAVLTDGTELGNVDDVLHLPGGDVLSIKDGDREVLVPFVKAIVPAVDLAKGELVVDPPEGLLALTEPTPEQDPV
ncbi:MAG: rRNA processing protein RimM [Frankiales bacterium]|nr:rRNA processing protein RimM [Frankiales bacterium]